MYLHWLLLLRLIFPWERYTCNFQLTAGLEAIISPCLDGTLGGTEEPDSGALRTAMLSSFSCYIEEVKCLMLAHIKYFILKLSLWPHCYISNAIHHLTFICGLSPFPLVDCHESRLPLIGSLTPPLVSGSTNKHFSFESISCEPSASFHYNINIIFYSNSNFVAILCFLQLLTEIWKLVWWILPMILGLFRLEAHTLIEP